MSVTIFASLGLIAKMFRYTMQCNKKDLNYILVLKSMVYGSRSS